MSISLCQSPGSLKRFRRTPWKFQQTFVTPTKNLEPFVATIISALGPLQAGTVTIDEVIFEPTHLLALVGTDSPPQFVHGSELSAVGADETEMLLRAALRDGIDFAFVPTPKPFALFADHDSFITFYAATKSNLNRVVGPLKRGRFEIVQGYQRPPGRK